MTVDWNDPEFMRSPEAEKILAARDVETNAALQAQADKTVQLHQDKLARNATLCR